LIADTMRDFGWLKEIDGATDFVLCDAGELENWLNSRMGQKIVAMSWWDYEHLDLVGKFAEQVQFEIERLKQLEQRYFGN
jgi:hypothetical protein